MPRPGFVARKRASEEVRDRSRKGSIDAPIRELVGEINQLGREHVFTTSSCSGRVSLVAEATEGKRTKGDAKWVFMSHDPVAGDQVMSAIEAYLDGSDCANETLTFRFEPFILAVECACLDVAKDLLRVAREAGFRESGIQFARRIIVSVRCSIRLELPVCKNGALLVSKDYIDEVTAMSSEKFADNFKRIDRFHALLKPVLARCVSPSNGEIAPKSQARLWCTIEKRGAKPLKDYLKSQKWLDQKTKAAVSSDTVTFPLTASFGSADEFSSQEGEAFSPSDCANFDAIADEVGPSPSLALVRLSSAKGSPAGRAAKTTPFDDLKRAVSAILAEDVSGEALSDLLSDLPHRWERLGKALLIPKTSMVKDHWYEPQHFDKIWPKVALALRCEKIGRQREIASNEIRESSADVIWPPGADGFVDHLENGIRYTFDFTKCMFSSGNGTEKTRVANFDCTNEVVVDMFAGIGYFTLPYLVKAKAKHLYACEWNPLALEALRRNLIVNGVENRCTVVEGDSSVNAPSGVADRINLGLIPDSSVAWAAALRALAPRGGWLHVHTNCGSSGEEITKAAEDMVERLRALDEEERSIEYKHIEKVKSYAPKIVHIVVDVLVHLPS